MHMPITADGVRLGLAEEIGRACAARLADTATLRPAAGGGAGTGWVFVAPVSGAVRGRVSVWFEHDAAVALCRSALHLDADPANDATVGWLREVVMQAAGVLESKPAAAGLTTGEPVTTVDAAPANATMYDVLMSNGLTCRIAAGAEFPPAPDMRLEAVLDVDLPLVVRFGRAVMPLRALADLGPGSVVDMGRSPDDLVELLVGERIIARGEVVIVGGNYAVRITDLASGSRTSADSEGSL
jgi:flagellar motor switch protein FliN/FliY